MKKEVYDHLGNKFESIRALCKHYGITTSLYDNRVNRLGWSLEQALTTPPAQKEIASVDHLGNKFPSQNALCKHYKISAGEFKRRINEMGWSLQKALTTPTKKSANNKVCDHEGREFKSIKALCEHYGISRYVYKHRKKRNWSLEKILTTPMGQTCGHVIIDHEGREFESIEALCRHYGITTSLYRNRIGYNWPLEKICTTPVKQVGNIVEDHKGNKFPSIKKLCDCYNITTIMYSTRIKRGWTLEKTLTTPARQQHRGVVEDHKGNKFSSIKEMCAHYGIKPEVYDGRIKRGWTIKDALTTKQLFERKRKIVDHLNNEFQSISEMCRYHNTSRDTCKYGINKGWSIIESLRIIPRIQPIIKNAEIIPDLHVINHVCGNTYLVVHNGTETLMHYDEIIRFATEYFRQQHAATA